MKEQRNRIISLLLSVVMLVGLLPTTALAADTYTKVGDISAVEATAPIAPAFGKDTVAPGFTITSPEGQGVRIVNEFWYKKNASNEWVGVGSSEKFVEGTYRLQVSFVQTKTKRKSIMQYQPAPRLP